MNNTPNESQPDRIRRRAWENTVKEWLEEAAESDSYPRVEAQASFTSIVDDQLCHRVQWVLTSSNYGYVEQTSFGGSVAYVQKIASGGKDATGERYRNLCLLLSSAFDVTNG